MNTAEPMDAKDLLSVTPEALVQAILKRREEAAKQLPDELAKRVDENDRAYAVFHEAKQRLEMMKNDGSSAEELEKATLDLEEKEEVMSVDEEVVAEESVVSDGEEEWPSIKAIPGLQASVPKSQSEKSKSNAQSKAETFDSSDSSPLGELRFQDE